MNSFENAIKTIHLGGKLYFRHYFIISKKQMDASQFLAFMRKTGINLFLEGSYFRYFFKFILFCNGNYYSDINYYNLLGAQNIVVID